MRGMGRIREKNQSVHMKLKSKLPLTTGSGGAKGASLQTSSAILASLTLQHQLMSLGEEPSWGRHQL